MSKVRLCGVDIDVVFSDPEDWEANGMGRSSQLNSRITIRKGMNEDLEGSVFLHEVIHLISDMNNLNFCNDETHVSVLANSLNTFLRDNKLIYWKEK